MRDLLEVTSPDFVLLADKPLELGGRPTKISTKEIEEKLDFKYYENILVSERDSKHKFNHQPEMEQIWRKIKHRLQTPLNDKLVICFINEQVGYGVFANDFIPAGTIIGLYAGQIEEAKERDDYGMSIVNTSFRINARRHGGITRFIQHMPFSLQHTNMHPLEKEEMQENKELEKIRDLATANIRSYIIEYEHKPILYFETCCNIQEGEQLGISYGVEYWTKKGIIPQYFYKTGEIVPKPLYLTSLDYLLQQYTSENSKQLIQKNDALRKAVFIGDTYDAKLLLFEYGALIDDQMDDASGHKRTPLHIAVLGYAQAVAKKDVRRMDGCKKAIELLLYRNADRDIKDKFGRTALHYAAINNLQDTARILLQNDVQVACKDSDGKKPFDYNLRMSMEIFQSSFKKERSNLLSSYQYIKVLKGEVKRWIEGEAELIAGLYVDETKMCKIVIFFGKKNNKRAISMLNYNEQNDLKFIKSEQAFMDVINDCLVICTPSQQNELHDLCNELNQSHIRYKIEFTEMDIITAYYKYQDGEISPIYTDFSYHDSEDFYGELAGSQKVPEKISDMLHTETIISEIRCYWCIDTKNNSLSIGFDNLAKALNDLGSAKEKHPQKYINLFKTKSEAEKYLDEKFKSRSASSGGVRKAFIFELTISIDNYIESFSKRNFENIEKQVSCIYQYIRNEEGNMKLLSADPKPNPMPPQVNKTTFSKPVNYSSI